MADSRSVEPGFRGMERGFSRSGSPLSHHGARLSQHGARLSQHGARLSQHGARLSRHGAWLLSSALPVGGKVTRSRSVGGEAGRWEATPCPQQFDRREVRPSRRNQARLVAPARPSFRHGTSGQFGACTTARAPQPSFRHEMQQVFGAYATARVSQPSSRHGIRQTFGPYATARDAHHAHHAHTATQPHSHTASRAAPPFELSSTVVPSTPGSPLKAQAREDARPPRPAGSPR